MGNRSPRHLRPGGRNMKGKLSETVCPCCDPIMNHKPKVLLAEHRKEIEDALAPAQKEESRG